MLPTAAPKATAGKPAKPEANGAGLRRRMEMGLGLPAAMTICARLVLLHEVQLVGRGTVMLTVAVTKGYSRQDGQWLGWIREQV